jgi:hypothetical protein
LCVTSGLKVGANQGTRLGAGDGLLNSATYAVTAAERPPEGTAGTVAGVVDVVEPSGPAFSISIATGCWPRPLVCFAPADEVDTPGNIETGMPVSEG